MTETPYLVVDVDVMDRNLTAMAASARQRGVSLRPHAKTHKCLEIARRQVDLGAAGLAVATIGEAEVFADGGFTDLFIAYPLWAAGSKADRLRALAERTELRVGVDSVESVALLAGMPLDVMVEIDSGHHRTGVQPDDAVRVASAAVDAGLTVAGVFTFPGHSYGPGRREQAAADESTALSQAAAVLVGAGIDAPVHSGGSTPTAVLAGSTVTEIRPGIYLFNDAQQVELGVASFADVALTAASTVVNRSGRSVVLDAGSKVLGADQQVWATGAGRLPDYADARIVLLSEHHAKVVFPDDGPMPDLGSVVRVAPNHVCAAVNLADELVVVQDGATVDTWRVAARGKNR
ncbi:D-TA family PLP-dependent enzyme [Acidothermaceae bacterium B102]|nr:D-TA family PLP-dependent enzyme [Acidothermaceae bacterium B102]